MRRRRLLRLLAAGGAWALLSAHSPYRQWEVYRKTRLVIVASHEDEEAVRLGRRVAATLARHLPGSRAMLARARDETDLIRLLASEQLDLALVEEGEAQAAAAGTRGLANGGAIPLRSLAQLGPYLLVCREGFPQPVAYRIAETLAERWAEIVEVAPEARGPRPALPARVALHPGASEYYAEHPARSE